MDNFLVLLCCIGLLIGTFSVIGKFFTGKWNNFMLTILFIIVVTVAISFIGRLSIY